MGATLESISLEKLKRNAERSFEVGQYQNAVADWVKATEIDRTDHESYWGIVRCTFILRPDLVIDQSVDVYNKALSYAPPEVRVQYMRQVEAHNAQASELTRKILEKKRKTLEIRL